MLERLWRSKTVVEQTECESNVKPKVVEETNDENVLPNFIGCRIIELEMEIEEGNLSQKLLIDLLHEYTSALEFYSERGDERYKLYQRKIQKFLMKETVDAVLRGKENMGCMIAKKEKTEEEVRKASFANKEQVKIILENSEADALKRKKNIENEVNQQMQSLEKRIQKKRSNSQISKTTTNNSLILSENPHLRAMIELKENLPQNKQKRLSLIRY